MTKGEALKKMQAVKAYMTSGNPIWGVTEMGEAFDMAIEALTSAQPESAKRTEETIQNVSDTDLISRKAAIDLANELYQGMDIIQVTYNEVRKAIVAFINLVPSARTEIVRCKDCKCYEGGWYCSAWNNSPGFPMVTEEGYCNLAERRTDERFD